MHRGGQGHVATISQCSDNQTIGVTNVLITVWENSCGLKNATLESITTWGLLLLESKLLGPLKRLDIGQLFFDQFFDNLLSMLLDNDQVGQLFDILL
jgi:hypothetical protein